MESKILDRKCEGQATCYLIRASIADYLDNLPQDFYNFEIQREETSNSYLDKLSQTLIRRGHIPIIVLLADKKDVKVVDEKLTVSNYRILDGLQRTIRMKAFRDSVELINNHFDEITSYGKSNNLLVRNYGKNLTERNIDASSFLKILEEAKKRGVETLIDAINEAIWIELWVGLSFEDQVKKMLVLNAGHKPVRTRHQLELIFLSLLPRLEKIQGDRFSIYREKDASSTTFSKNRKPGQFHFASIIAALVSYFSAKPITTNSALVSDLQSEDDPFIRDEVSNFTFRFSENLVDFLVSLDDRFSRYGSIGIQWYGREVTLVGIFSALGTYRKEHDISNQEVFDRFLEASSLVDFSLEKFEESRNSQNLSRVNIGNVNKKAVYLASLDLLAGNAGEKIVWSNYFGA